MEKKSLCRKRENKIAKGGWNLATDHERSCDMHLPYKPTPVRVAAQISLMIRFWVSLTLTLTLSPSPSITHSLFPPLPLSLTHSPSPSITHSLSHSLPLSFSYSQSLSLSLSKILTFSHTHSFSFSPSPPPSPFPDTIIICHIFYKKKIAEQKNKIK